MKKLNLEINDKKFILLTLDDLVIKLKFFEIEKYQNDSTGRTRMRFSKEQGENHEFYEFIMNLKKE